MKYIPIPDDAPLFTITGQRVVNESGAQESVSFLDFALGRLGDPLFASDIDAVLSAVQIKQSVERAREEGAAYLAVESADYKRLLAATKTPKQSYPAAIAHCFAPFMIAIRDASDKPPKPEETAAKEAAE